VLEMGIGKKLMVAFSVLLLFIITISAFSYYNLSKINGTYQGLVESELEGVYGTSDLKTSIAMQGIQVRQYILTPSTTMYETLQQTIEVVNQDLEGITSIATSTVIKNKIEDLKALNGQIQQSIEKVIDAVDQNKTDVAVQIVNNEIRTSNLQLTEGTDEILTLVKTRFNDATIATDGQAKLTLLIILIIFAISIITTITLLLNFNKNVTKPLVEVVKNAERIGNGDLTADDLVVRTKDEIGILANAFNQMKESLQHVLHTTKENALDLSAMAEELTASTNIVADTSTTVAANVEQLSVNANKSSAISKETSVAMISATEGVQSIVEASQSISSEITDMVHLATNGSEYMDQAKQQMTVIYDSAKGTADLIQRLSVQSEEIQKISKVITEITEQTNLLALNAAIEAARAGENGKGFAVVADEVRKLAEQSKHSADAIVKLTTSILTETQNVEGAMALGLSSVQEGVVTLEQSDAMFTQIVTAIQQMTNKVTGIHGVTEELSVACEQVAKDASHLSEFVYEIAQSTENITQQVEEQTATIQEIHSVSDHLASKSMNLTNTISKFTLKG
jgi:methyl-accepting chemotaxis protein